MKKLSRYAIVAGVLARIRSTRRMAATIAVACLAVAGLAAAAPMAQAASVSPATSCVATTAFSGSGGDASVNGWYTNYSNNTVCVGTVESTYTADTTANYSMRVRVWQLQTNTLLYSYTDNPIPGGPPSVGNGVAVRQVFNQAVEVCVAWNYIGNVWDATCVDVP
jgi:hypothetical protein